MGSSTAETLKEIEEIRTSLDGKMRVLDQRLPRPAVWARRSVGILLGGGALASIAMAMLRRRRKKEEPATRVRIEIVPEVPARVYTDGDGAEGRRGRLVLRGRRG